MKGRFAAHLGQVLVCTQNRPRDGLGARRPRPGIHAMKYILVTGNAVFTSDFIRLRRRLQGARYRGFYRGTRIPSHAGGILSGLGKGTISSSIGVLLKAIPLSLIGLCLSRTLLGTRRGLQPTLPEARYSLQACGWRVTAIKLDPYLNVDARTTDSRGEVRPCPATYCQTRSHDRPHFRRPRPRRHPQACSI